MSKGNRNRAAGRRPRKPDCAHDWQSGLSLIGDTITRCVKCGNERSHPIRGLSYDQLIVDTLEINP